MARHYVVAMFAVLCLVCVANGQLQNVGSAAVEAAVRNPRYMRRQINCLLNESPCDNIGRNMKRKYLHQIPFKLMKKLYFQSHFHYYRIGAVLVERSMSRLHSRSARTSHASFDPGQPTVPARVLSNLLYLRPVGGKTGWKII